MPMPPGGFIRGFLIKGNVLFNAGLAHTQGDRKDNLLVASRKNPIGGIVLKENMGWTQKPEDRSVNLGRYDKAAGHCAHRQLLQGPDHVQQQVCLDQNGGQHLLSAPTGQIDIAQFPDNTYLTNVPKR